MNKIQRFDAFGEEDWVDMWTNDVNTLIESEQNAGNEGVIYRTYVDGFDKIYFYMTDKYGHTGFFRINEEDFYIKDDRK